MLKRPSPKNVEVRDLLADNPVGTMDRFTAGLRHVLAVRKKAAKPIKPKRPHRHT